MDPLVRCLGFILNTFSLLTNPSNPRYPVDQYIFLSLYNPFPSPHALPLPLLRSSIRSKNSQSPCLYSCITSNPQPPDDCQWSSYNGHFRWHCNSSRYWPVLPPVLLFLWLFLYLCVTQLNSISHTVHSLWCPCLDFHPRFYLLAWLPRVQYKSLLVKVMFKSL